MLHATRSAAIAGAELETLLANLDVQRGAYRALGVADPVELEVCVLTREPFSWTRRPRADALRARAREGLPATATSAEVDAAAIRLLREWAGLGHVRWPSPWGDGPHGHGSGEPSR